MKRSASIFSVLESIALLAMLLPSSSQAKPLCGPFLRVLPIGYGLNDDGRVLVRYTGRDDDRAISSTAALWLGAVLQKVEFVDLVSTTAQNAFVIRMDYLTGNFPSSREVIDIPRNSGSFTGVLKNPITFQDEEFQLVLGNDLGKSTSKRLKLHLDVSNWFCPFPVK